MLKLIKDFFSENGQGSSKRLIAIFIALILGWAIVFAVLKATTEPARQSLVNATMVFILILLGVATIPQLVTLIRGGSPAKDEGNTIDKTKEE